MISFVPSFFEFKLHNPNTWNYSKQYYTSFQNLFLLQRVWPDEEKCAAQLQNEKLHKE